jgi:hypothetical protein
MDQELCTFRVFDEFFMGPDPKIRIRRSCVIQAALENF